MSHSNDERQQDSLDATTNTEQISPLSNRFLVAHSSPVLDSSTEVVTRAQDDSFQSSSSTSNSKSSSSTASRSSRLHFLMMHHHSAVNSPLMYSRCTSLGSLASYDIRSSCNDSYTSECSSVKPSGIISPSDLPDSPPCEPELIEEEEEEHPPVKRNNQTLTMNTTSSNNRTTMMSETVIEKTFVFNQYDVTSNRISHIHHQLQDVEDDDDERLDEVIVYSCDRVVTDACHVNKPSYEDEIICDDTCHRYASETDEDDSLIDARIQNDASFAVPLHENLSVITEETSFIEEMNSNDDTSSIKILYDLIKKPHWTTKPSCLQLQQPSNHSFSSSDQFLQQSNMSFSSNPSSLSLDSNEENLTDDEDEYDQEKGRQLIQRLIEETLIRRSVPTEYLHSTSCVLCPSNTPMTTATRSVSSSSSSSLSASTKSCTCVTNRSASSTQQPQRSQSSPARPSSTAIDDSKRQTMKQKENTVHHTRSSYLRLRQAQQNKRLHQHDKKC